MLALLLSYFVTRYLTRAGGWLRILDHPNRRSLHSHPVPRTGGLGVLLAIYAGWGLAYLFGSRPPHMAMIILASVPVALVSFLDDRRGVSPIVRLVVHLSTAVGFVLLGFDPVGEVIPGLEWPNHTLLASVVAILFTVWMINLYNFMDGIDGLAGGMGVWGFGSLGLIAWLNGGYEIAVACWILAGACSGFLFWNFPPAKIFLGDSGSSSLGLFMAAVSLWGSSTAVFPLWIPVLIFSPFIVDATITLLRRGLRGDRLWAAHRSHYYQRCAKRVGHGLTTRFFYLLMAGCAVSAILANSMVTAGQWMVIGAWCALYISLGWLIERQAPFSVEKRT